MTTNQIIACAISWTAAIAACVPLIQLRREQRRNTVHYHLEWSAGGGVFKAGPLTEEEFEKLRARLEREYAKYRGGHAMPVTELRDEEQQ